MISKGRTLGWGPTSATKDVKNLIIKVDQRSEQIVLDRW